ncbi:cytochrome d ubiquinol oxidase subunit II [Reyranella soli]|jgi:cytochrome d ubiquinol oxidase subunit II|uniref:Quinol oxidase subunit II protein n=1 Tax=Reyranella soli TaxID=1230389 RepID=A0A512NDG6_9HYPH|nr:cytochrome d ubiquinol oxidase subunit II [Reyranella soli]GEP57001.1 quinol oxidase subunit II protein [Reyranella soli]
MISFWVAVLSVSILLYVLLDGFDLGIGIIFGFMPTEARRASLLQAIEPLWDGNETWLVVTGVVLWGAFPIVYATLLSAFYLPLLAMLGGLILRGVAFEFRDKAERLRWIWDAGFALGSLVAAFVQGVAVGALVEGLPMSDGQYVGGDFGWASPFALLCGVGLCVGYALLGAAWLAYKCEGELKDTAYRLIRFLAPGLLFFLVVVFAFALNKNFAVMERWLTRPILFLFPMVGVSAGALLGASVKQRWDAGPFITVAIIFVSAFGTLALSFWPYMIPFSITIDQAAAPRESLSFMFWGAGLFVFPLMLVYVVFNYRVFRGKNRPSADHY